MGKNMTFNRKSAIFLSIVLFIGGMAIPVLSALYLSWIQAKELEHDKLFTIAKMAIRRSRICLNEIYQTLDELEAYNRPVCTPAHLKKMQNAVFNKSCINEIQYLENGGAKCGSEGNVRRKSNLSSKAFVMPNGTSISFDILNFSKNEKKFIRFQRNNYAISIDTNSLTDLIAEPYMKIAIATEDGQVISTLNYYSPNVELINSVLKNPNLKETANSLISVYRAPGLYYIVSESFSYVFKTWKKSLFLFLLFGFIMSLIASGAVIWSLKRRLSDLGELKLAVANREFMVYYQPIVEFKAGICIGAEALIRWKKSDGTMVSPDLFIPLAEKSGLIQSITDQVIESVVADLNKALYENRNLHISINVSVLDFNSKRIFKKLDTIIAKSDIKPKQIWLEITERGFIDFNSTRDSLNNARKLGYIIVIDDFGTGYSSLSYLKELPIDVLKIDKSFVNSVCTDSVTSNVTEHIIDIAKELNLKIVAEGVETIEEANYLKERQVDFAQGWLYAKAMPLNEFLAFYQKNRPEKIGNANV
jgi:sensor c-di-GMP phosphodiesterase-like protein